MGAGAFTLRRADDAIDDCLNFNEAALRQRCHGKAGAGRERRRHKGFHGFVDGVEIGHVGKEDRYFDDIGHRETGFRDDCTQILEGRVACSSMPSANFPVAGSMPSCPEQ